MEMPFGDICDRYTISLLKQQHMPSEHHKGQVDTFKAEIDKKMETLSDVQENRLIVHLKVLHFANGLTWDAEASLRNAMDDNLDSDEYKWRTIQLKVSNQLRVDTRNKISDMVGEGVFKEIKVKHASE